MHLPDAPLRLGLDTAQRGQTCEVVAIAAPSHAPQWGRWPAYAAAFVTYRVALAMGAG